MDLNVFVQADTQELALDEKIKRLGALYMYQSPVDYDIRLVARR